VRESDEFTRISVARSSTANKSSASGSKSYPWSEVSRNCRQGFGDTRLIGVLAQLSATPPSRKARSGHRASPRANQSVEPVPTATSERKLFLFCKICFAVAASSFGFICNINATTPVANGAAARVDSFTGSVPNPRWGYGKISAENALSLTANTLLRITNTQKSGNDIHVFFTSVVGKQYRVEYRSALNSGTWATLNGYTSVAGTGGVIDIVDSGAIALGHRFYHVVPLL